MPGGLGRLTVITAIPMEQGMSALSNTEELAMRTLMQAGIQPPIKPPDGTADMPEDLTSLDDNQLGDLLNRIGQYCGFVEFKLAEARIARDAAEARMEFVKSSIRITLKNSPTEGTKLTASDKDDLVRVHPQVVETQRDYNYKFAFYELTLRVRDSAQRNWETVSRRITQRGQEIERMKREINVANTQAPASRTFRR